MVSRLLKEGSNADEPGNIALSEYSSLSSGGESSSDDEANKNRGAQGKLGMFGALHLPSNPQDTS